MMDAPSLETPPADAAQDKDARAYPIILAGLLLTVVAAFGLGFLLKAPPLARFSLDGADAGAGVIGAMPLIAALLLFMRTKHGGLAAFRESQIEFFANIGFRFTPLRIAVMAAGAGVSEELLFRGVLQEWSDRFLPLWLALVLTNMLFGALHARTVLYAVTAGAVGAYLGLIYVTADNLLTPIVAHALYDAVALDLARRAIERRQVRIAEKSGSSITG